MFKDVVLLSLDLSKQLELLHLHQRQEHRLFHLAEAEHQQQPEHQVFHLQELRLLCQLQPADAM
jgi:hypothetical protein